MAQSLSLSPTKTPPEVVPSPIEDLVNRFAISIECSPCDHALSSDCQPSVVTSSVFVFSGISEFSIIDLNASIWCSLLRLRTLTFCTYLSFLDLWFSGYSLPFWLCRVHRVKYQFIIVFGQIFFLLYIFLFIYIICTYRNNSFSLFLIIFFLKKLSTIKKKTKHKFPNSKPLPLRVWP